MRCRLARTGLTFFCMVIFAAAAYAQQAQKRFFVYIQNEAGTPFYVKSRDSLMSSSPAGYLIIPRLQKGQYTLTIGFPKNQMPEASFGVDVSGSGDQGFLIRKAAGGFDLVSLRDSRVLEPLAVASAPGNRIISTPAMAPVTRHPKTNKKHTPASAAAPATAAPQNAVPPSPAPAAEDTGAFSRMLNQITGTSEPAPSVPAPTASAKKQMTATTDTPSVAQKPAGGFLDLPSGEPETTTPAPDVPEAEVPVKHAAPPRPQPQFITFAPDSAAPETDTETATAPAAVTEQQSASETDSLRELKRQERRLRREAQQAEKRAEKQAENQAGNPPEKADSEAAWNPFSPAVPQSQGQQQAVTEAAGTASDSTAGIPNSDCGSVAGEDDFQKVRRKMASRSSEQSILNVAKKYFDGDLCYTTSQIRSLTYLFATDAYKFRFLELAYPHTADARNFSSLIGTLEDASYRDRFKAMVK